MTEGRVADLLGVRPGAPVRWERPLLYFMALIASGVVGGLAFALQVALERGNWDARLAAGTDWSRVLMVGRALIYAAVAPLAFRLVRNAIAAALAAAVVAGPLLQLISAAASAAQRPQAGFHADLSWMGQASVGVLVTFLALEVGLRLVRRRWLGLLVGTTIGAVGALAVKILFQVIRGQPPNPGLVGAALDLIPRAMFAVVLSASLAAASPDDDEPARAGAERSRRGPDGFHTGAIVAADWTLLLLSLALVTATIVNAGRYRSDIDRLAGLIVSLAMLALVILRSVVFCTWLHRVWSGIQDEQSSITPGKAVGLLFVPFFNLYWAFRAIAGIPDAHNAVVARRGLAGAPFLSPGPFKTYVLLVEATLVPLFGFFAVIAAIASRALSPRDAPTIIVALLFFGGLVTIGACLIEVPMLRIGSESANRLRALQDSAGRAG